jgi:hypothetical protein
MVGQTIVFRRLSIPERFLGKQGRKASETNDGQAKAPARTLWDRRFRLSILGFS